MNFLLSGVCDRYQHYCDYINKVKYKFMRKKEDDVHQETYAIPSNIADPIPATNGLDMNLSDTVDLRVLTYASDSGQEDQFDFRSKVNSQEQNRNQAFVKTCINRDLIENHNVLNLSGVKKPATAQNTNRFAFKTPTLHNSSISTNKYEQRES